MLSAGQSALKWQLFVAPEGSMGELNEQIRGVWKTSSKSDRKFALFLFLSLDCPSALTIDLKITHIKHHKNTQWIDLCFLLNMHMFINKHINIEIGYCIFYFHFWEYFTQTCHCLLILTYFWHIPRFLTWKLCSLLISRGTLPVSWKTFETIKAWGWVNDKHCGVNYYYLPDLIVFKCT